MTVALKQSILERLPRAAQNRAEFLEERRPIIGGSDAAAACGKSDYSSRLSLYAEKVGLVTRISKEGTAGFRPMYWGSKHERSLREYYLERTGRAVYAGQLCADGEYRLPLLIHPEHKFMGAHLDGLVLDENGDIVGAVECKTAGAYMKSHWGDEGSDEIPESYLFQVQHSLEVVSAWFPQITWIDVPVLIGGNEDRLFRVHKNDPLIEQIIRLESEFMYMVENRIEPEIDGSDASNEYLKDRYPADDGTTIQVTPELDTFVHNLQQAKVKQKIAEADRTRWENKIKEQLGEASVLEGPDYKITWKKSKDSEQTDWQAAFRELAKSVAVDEDVAQRIVESNTSVRAGYRTFRTYGDLFKS